MTDGSGNGVRRVVLLGAAGATGRSTLAALRDAGIPVVAHSRRAGPGLAMPMADDPGVTWVGGDLIGDPAALEPVFDGADAVIDLRVALPTSLRTAGDLRNYRRVRDRGVREVVDAAEQCGVPRIVHDTITMIYRDGGDRWLDEHAPVTAPGPMKANLAGEEHLRAFTERGGIGVDLRLGIVHGNAGEDPMAGMLEWAARRGWFALPGKPDGYLSTIALSDVGRAVVAALDAPAGVYNVAEEPRTRRQWRRAYAHGAGRDDLRGLPGMLGGPLGASLRVSSARFAAATGWEPEADPLVP